ncbi:MULTISPECIES: class I SAM-dependent methyltransferase [Streptomyces]|uniref:class I SAM-dependent methyltransferase n=1 Tax=Streptomyces TaxID=1883 RepID=UPI001E37139B|nr:MULTISPECIES: methyltransferase domain-containing protein [Streptomyces]UFQ14997.1 methyltransferase domain-containing protein [Streptomyces huasconensis]WCL84603.1 methyltransferase domain-containing protein [Streptomyces sp. JCM 35825]
MTRIDGHLLDPRRLPDPRQLSDARQAESKQRFAAYAALFDPTTFGHIERLGIGPGWRCWEVGAGGTSVISWLAKRVGPTGKVLATDIDTSWQTRAARSPLEVRTHDVAADPPPVEAFDLVHARLVLGEVADPEQALKSMLKALRPGGRLLVEEADPALQPLACPDDHGPAQELANRLRHAVRTLLAERGVDLTYGRRLPRLLREAGLRQVGSDAYFPLVSPACAALETATLHQLRPALIEAGLTTPDDLDHHLSNVTSTPLDLAAPPLISTWGRKP